MTLAFYCILLYTGIIKGALSPGKDGIHYDYYQKRV